MLVGILSDTHDHLDRIAAALQRFEQVGVEVILHAGDLVAPFAAKALKRWRGPLHVVYGNNDGERAGLKAVLEQIQEGPVMIECGGRKISLDHYPPSGQRPAAAGAVVVVFGHTHQPIVEKKDGVVHINPGECCGWVTGRSTIAVLDTASLAVDLIELASFD